MPRPRILLVEDHWGSRKLMHVLLRDAGYEVSAAENAASALVAAAQWPPDLVLTDFHLPDMNGLELARSLRTRLPSAAIPILIMSANRMLDVASIQERDRVVFISKLVDTQAFVEAVSAHLPLPRPDCATTEGSS